MFVYVLQQPAYSHGGKAVIDKQRNLGRIMRREKGEIKQAREQKITVCTYF